MIRLLTFIGVCLLVACGGGSGGGGDQGTAPTLQSLFPIADQPANTILPFMITRTVSGSPASVFPRNFRVGHQPGGSGPDLHTIADDDNSSRGGGVMWTERGLELTAFAQTSLAGAGGLCVTATSPGFLLVPAALQPGQSHMCDLPGIADSTEFKWIGPEAVAGYPDAHRFELSVAGPHSNNSSSSPRFGATSFEVTLVLHASPGKGPVSGTYTQRFLNGSNPLQTKTYEFSAAP